MTNLLKTGLMALAVSTALAMPSSAMDKVDPANWDSVKAAAKGTTVHWHAWGGSPRINAYIDWAAQQVESQYGVEVVHVKVDDTANVVSQVVAEKAAGKNKDGAVDLIWINGENFASMKEQNLLLDTDGDATDGWATQLPNWQYVDVAGKPTITTDFTIPTDGLESPWGMAKMVFFHDTALEKELPGSAAELLQYAQANPGRFTYPLPPDFIGSSFLKQILSEVVVDPTVLQSPVVEDEFEATVEPLWTYLDAMHAVAWQSGRNFPKSYPAMRQLLADGEVDFAFAFNPADASAAIAAGELPDTVRSFVFDEGTLGNTHFVAIPYNAAAPAGALVLANFLISPEAQKHKQDPDVWGDPTVLDITSVPADVKAQFDALDLGIATLSPDELGPMLPEPHASWMSRIEVEWARRYGAGN
ncbi:MAG: ABC transporter substrate-binding protein [Pseudomonadota bacterium]